MPEKIARVQATIYVTTHLSIAPKDSAILKLRNFMAKC